MKTHLLLGTIALSLIALVGCTNNADFFKNAQVNQNLLKETWMREVNTNPGQWTRHADVWYFTGNPNATEQYANSAPPEKAMSVMAVKASQFNNIKVNGCFQVQIVGGQEKNSVYILGSNKAVRQTAVQLVGDTVCISQTKEGGASTASLNNVIVRIGVRNLHMLSVTGSARVEGRNILSNALMINAKNDDMILLSGNMNLLRVDNRGAGSVSILGANTPSLIINDMGHGDVNISGRVGIQSIRHVGNGTVSIIGADSNALTIKASGAGLTTVAGYVNLKKVIALDQSRVYVYWVNSINGTYVMGGGDARIGLAGMSNSIDIHLNNSSRYEGRSLHADTLYVQTHQYSHANVAADKKLFAAAADQSSIYFSGSPTIMSRYTTHSGIVLPVWGDEDTALRMPLRWTGPSPDISPWSVRKSPKTA